MLQKMYSDNIAEAKNSRSQSEHAEGVKSKKLDFLFYWRALRKNKWPITIFTAIMAVVAIYYSLMATPIYEARSTLLLESQKANITSIEDLVSSEQESLDYYGTQIAILRSRGLADRVIRQIELQDNIPQTQLRRLLAPSATQQLAGVFGFAGDSDDGAQSGDADIATRYRGAKYDELLRQFRDSLRISPVAKTKLVNISYESTDPEFSALAANAIANQYIESVLERRKGVKDGATTWMDGRITELKLKLDESESALLSFKESNGLITLDGGVGRLSEQELLLTSSELASAKSELSNARDLYRKIQNFKASSPKSLESLPIVQNDALVRSVKTELGQAQRDLDSLRNRYGAKHPRIVDAQSRLASLRSILNGHIERIVVTSENDYQLLQQRVDSLGASIAQGKESIQVIGQKKIVLDALEREVSANRDQYNTLFDRITETRTTDGLDEANAVVAEAAWVSSKPIKPSKMLIVALTVLGSLLLACLICFLIEFLDDTVSNSEDIERRLKTKLLGVLPIVDMGFLKRKSDLPLTPKDVHAESETFAEAVNTCRTALSISNNHNAQVILVTSSVPNEGKSTVALNLAYSFGKLKRTLLIDCDLRKPSIASALGIPATSVGLSSLIEQNALLNNFIKRDVLDSFDCLTSGPSPDQPLEMLASAKFAAVLELLRQRYDKIIIDSAPTHVVSDALVLSKLVDSVLYVVRPHKTPIKVVDNGLSRLAEASASVAGVCLSQVDINKSQSYGTFEFHGFGIDYHGYKDYYREDENKVDRPMTEPKSEGMKIVRSSDYRPTIKGGRIPDNVVRPAIKQNGNPGQFGNAS